MKKILQKLTENKIVVDVLLILVCSIILSIPNFSKNADIYFDDGCQHLMRAYGAYKEMVRGGNINIIADFANGFGYSWDLFYGPFSEYVLIILGIIFHSFGNGLKVLEWLIVAFSGLFLYKLVYEITYHRKTALLAAMIYITAPYFFTDLYIRHSLGECMAFMWIPLVFLGLYRLFNTEKTHYYLVFRYSGFVT